MNDHEHDLDIVAALAEGRTTDTGRAEQLIRTCDVCAEAYRAHVVVLDAVAAEPPPRLDDLERRRLRASVWDRVVEDEPGSVPVQGRPAPWWYRVAPVAAALVVVVGIAVALPRGGGDAGSDEIIDAAAPVTEQLSESDTATADTPAADEETRAEATESAGEDAGATDTTTAAADTTAAAESLADDGTDRVDDEITIETTTEDLPEEQEAFAQRAAERSSPMPLPPEVAECLQGDPDLDGPFLAAERALVDGREATFVAQGEPGTVTRVIVYADGTCEILATHLP